MCRPEQQFDGAGGTGLAIQKSFNDGGSTTLTSGIVGAQTIRYGANAAAVNKAGERFVVGAAVALPRGLCINVVRPTVLQESMPGFELYFVGVKSPPVSLVAFAYVLSVDGLHTGQLHAA